MSLNDEPSRGSQSHQQLMDHCTHGNSTETEGVSSHEYNHEGTYSVSTIHIVRPFSTRRRAFFIRTLALLCICSLSIGSHYASYILGPIKSRLSRELGTSHTEFSLLISAFSLNSTWTPLIGGFMANRLGTTFTSILATGVILLGQILLLMGDIWGNVRLMAFGMFIFGLGVSPLAVVQETIIVRFFKSHSLGVSMAFGLLAGKGASFISARTSYPLTERFGTRAPFYVATSLAGLSVFVNLAYILASRWMIDGTGAELEAPEIEEEARRRRSLHSITEAQALEKVAEHRRVDLRGITRLGDIFWVYVAINILCGMIWSPFAHLAANIIQIRYNMTEEHAASQASYLLAGSIFLYPVCGYVVDRMKRRAIVLQLLTLSSSLTLLAYIWLSLPPKFTQLSFPAILTYGAGQGFAPLLLVVIVPQIVPPKYVSTALGIHKSLEQTGSTIFQTLAGLALDSHSRKSKTPGEEPSRNVQRLLNVFVLLNFLFFLGILGMARLQIRKRRACRTILHPRTLTTDSHQDDPTLSEHSLLLRTDNSRICDSCSGHVPKINVDESYLSKGTRRGEICAGLCLVLIIFAWVLFLGTAWYKLRSSGGRGL